MSVTFTLNGAKKTIPTQPGDNLQAVLQGMGIPSVRDSDGGEGFSGSDTILLDGKAVLAGLMVAGQAEGHSIETVESLAQAGRLSMLQEAMLDAGVVQSAYNSPAAALLLEELLRRKQAPTEEDVREALSGLFSRATGYRQFFLAVELARKRREDSAQRLAPTPTPVSPQFAGRMRLIGKPKQRVDGVKLVAGMKAYVEDRVEPGSCVLKMLRSPHAHAYINEIDTSAAEAMPGVVAVLTWKNTPSESYGSAGQGFPEPSPYDRTMFCRKVRHVGDRVAAVVAEEEATAARALAAIKVEYEVLQPVLSLDAAIAARTLPVHAGPALLASGEPAGSQLSSPDPREGGILYQFSIGADPSRNLAAHTSGAIGDVGKAFAEAEVVVERAYTTSKVQCTPLEPHVAYTKMDGDRLIIHASTQVPWHLRRIVAKVLGIRENRIRVIKERVGGGYGSKQDILLEEVCAFATFLTGRSIFYKYTREEEFVAATTRHPFRFTVKMGAKRDGTLTGISLQVEADTGAYGNHCLTVPMNACSKSLPLFRCDNVSFDVKSYYTNQVPSGAYQGYGAPQGSFAVQTCAAELAKALGMEYIDFVEKNRVREGDVLEVLTCLGEGRAGSAARVRSCGLGEALQKGRELASWDTRDPAGDPDVKIGRGVAIIQQGSGLPGLDQACADVKLLSDGTIMVRSGGADLGTGLDTVLAKIAAETLCCDMDHVAVLTGDTDLTPFDKGAYASSGTFFSGNAVLKASQALSRRILEAAALHLGEPAEGLAIKYPSLVVGARGKMSFEDIARKCQTGEGIGELAGSASFTTEDSAFPYAAHFCAVSVNTRTGEIKVLKYCAVQDCGVPINPELSMGQVYGAILKSIGHTLYEEMIFDSDGRCLTTGLADYGAPMIQELPPEVQVGFVETHDPFGPFGAKSVSEVSMNGAAPAIAVAIHDAVGVWMRDWPMTPERLLKALGRF